MCMCAAVLHFSTVKCVKCLPQGHNVSRKKVGFKLPECPATIIKAMMKVVNDMKL